MNIAVLLSGGVDSSVALRLLQEAGHTVTAFYLKIWLEDELSFLGTCPWEEDLSYARAVCEQANVPLEIVSLQRAYHEQVVAAMVAQVGHGLTPNPDIMCNQRVKFGAFYAHLEQFFPNQFDKVATGHYAQLITLPDGTVALQRAVDPVKDQTYFLSQMRQAQLARALFPIGHLAKQEVRVLAEQFNLPNRARKDSQGICFLGKLKFSEFVKSHLGEAPGPICEYETGAALGEHRGLWFHTIGQRQGLGLGGGPWYVVAKDQATRTLLVSRNYYAEDKVRTLVTIADCNWVAGVAPASGVYRVKMRHGPYEQEVQLRMQDAQRAELLLAANDQGIAPGQHAVLYEGSRCLGGGMIVERGDS